MNKARLVLVPGIAAAGNASKNQPTASGTLAHLSSRINRPEIKGVNIVKNGSFRI